MTPERERRYRTVGRYALTTADRLAARTKRGDGCWTWTGFVDQDGRGWMRMDGKNTLVHRVAWILTYGPIPEGMCVCHHCDLPRCVRPDHLFLGTQADNVRDMLTKGRQRLGGRTKLSPEQVLEIYARLKRGETGPALAREFNIDRSCVTRIGQRKAFRYLLTAAHPEEAK